MDRNRYEKEKRIFKNFNEHKETQKYINYRLTCHDEIPNWIKDTPKLLEEKEYGRGNRIRTKVNYQENDPNFHADQMEEEEEEEFESNQAL